MILISFELPSDVVKWVEMLSIVYYILCGKK